MRCVEQCLVCTQTNVAPVPFLHLLELWLSCTQTNVAPVLSIPTPLALYPFPSPCYTHFSSALAAQATCAITLPFHTHSTPTSTVPWLRTCGCGPCPFPSPFNTHLSSALAAHVPPAPSPHPFQQCLGSTHAPCTFTLPVHTHLSSALAAHRRMWPRSTSLSTL